jgi:hypothetical protein
MLSITVLGVMGENTGYQAPGQNLLDKTNEQFIVDCLITLTGNYGTAASHGDPLSFRSVLDAVPGNLAAGSQNIPSQLAPGGWEFHELVLAGSVGPGFRYEYHPDNLGPTATNLTAAAPTQNGGVLYISGAGAASGQGDTEITAGGAYAGTTPSLNNQVLRARFWFTKFI